VKRLLLLLILILAAAALLSLLWRRLAGAGPRPHPEPAPATGAWLLFLLPLPVAAAAVVALARGQFLHLLGDSLGYGLLLGGALLVRRALEAGRSLSDSRSWKPLGCALVGLGTGVTAWLGAGHGPAIGAAFAVIAAAGCGLTYGFDLAELRRPRRGHDLGQPARTALQQAARSITAIEQASGDIRQPELDARLTRIAGLGREILARLREDPRDLRRARKFLNVYLDGVQRIVEGYAKTHGRAEAPQLDERFRKALVTVEDAFRKQQQVLLERDVEDLDVQIEVLTRQLEREGIL
jgi:hypothetical protein